MSYPARKPIPAVFRRNDQVSNSSTTPEIKVSFKEEDVEPVHMQKSIRVKGNPVPVRGGFVQAPLPPIGQPSEPPNALKRIKSRSSIVWKPSENAQTVEIPACRLVLSLVACVAVPLLAVFLILLIPLSNPHHRAFGKLTYTLLHLPLSGILMGGVLNCWYLDLLEVVLSTKQLVLFWLTPLLTSLLVTVTYIGLAYLTSSDILPTGAVAGVFPAIPLHVLIVFLLCWDNPNKPTDFARRFLIASAGLLLFPLTILCVIAFVFFFPDIGHSLQALLGFFFPFLAFLFRWVAHRMAKVFVPSSTPVTLPADLRHR